ncbi:unnamed protein product [Mytilus coruscus]|uniref:Endonuclease/exonuclease/phosphatase domain-containing protein n=1 Tax=Mytilus coruscus TaxID=42192 RepID=A0A6J8D8Q2_MYTCO|nr:unnamed protein product [Mytilus coruscus]
MFSEIENVIADTELQICLLGDFNAHTSDVNEHVVIDNNILDFCNVPNVDQAFLNNLHILEECGISISSNTDFNVLPFDPILSDVHNPICLQLCLNIAGVNKLNVSVELNITNDSDIVIACEGESIVKPRWASDRAPVFTEKLDDNSKDELLNGLEDIDPQNTNIVIINKAVDDCNNIIKNAAEHADMFVKINNSNA